MKMHMNHHLPPVDCQLLLLISRAAANQMGVEREVDMPGGMCLVKARRTGYIANKTYDYEVVFANGHKLTGRWDWAYP